MVAGNILKVTLLKQKQDHWQRAQPRGREYCLLGEDGVDARTDRFLELHWSALETFIVLHTSFIGQVKMW